MSKTALLFSGQGAQYSGMLKEEYDVISEVREIFDIADRVLNRKISDLCFYGEAAELNNTHNTQVCMLAADLAAYEVVKRKGIHIDGVAGFSLGEYAALVAAGCVSVEDAFRLVQRRADAMQEAVPAGQGSMAAIMKLDVKTIEKLLQDYDGKISIANYNSPLQTVVSGYTDAIDELMIRLKEQKIRTVKLAVSAPFHCEMMRSASVVVEEEFDRIKIVDPTVELYLNYDGRCETDRCKIADKVIKQTFSPVRWTEIMTAMSMAGFDTFIECGPGDVLTKLTTKNIEEANAFSYRTFLEE